MSFGMVRFKMSRDEVLSLGFDIDESLLPQDATFEAVWVLDQLIIKMISQIDQIKISGTVVI